ncbi:MAG: DUF1822 family protein [Leptolyngbyaceae cyanobacterium RU_5_1]|nr:DUF1822 family protein [Leptolyngbyaceae cyanobacterium RU_5_1]
MSQITESLIFTVPLSFEAHAIAQQYQKQQSQPLKAKQVYLNTLAVYAVNFYLRCLGFEVDVDDSDSRNPLIVKFMDVADLSIKQVGKLECRPVLPDAHVCQIPSDVWCDRIGYVAVQLSQTLKQAKILGFTQTVAAEIPLTQLRSLSEFPEYLDQIRQTISTASTASTAQTVTANSQTIVNLRTWFEGVFESGWQSIEDILGVNITHPVFVRSVTPLKNGIKRAKLINLGMQLGELAVVLSIAIGQNRNDTVSALVQLYPGPEQSWLPANVTLTMLSESGEILQQVCTRGQDNYIQLRHFKGHTGDQFSIQVSLGNVSVTEDFIL